MAFLVRIGGALTEQGRTCRAALPAAAAAGIALALSSLVPLLGPLLIALVLGAVVANSRLDELSVLRNQAKVTRLLLRLGVILLGLKLSIVDILDIGLGGIAVVVATVVLTYLSTIVIGDRLGLDRGYVTLLAAGFSICGAAAIAAIEDTVGAKQRYVALSVAMVTVFGTVMIVVLPPLARAMDLTAEQSAVWAGASIHEVAQVVAAASLLGPGAVAVAITVKLGRVVLLGPMYVVASRRGGRVADRRVPLVPWFVVGFAAAVALRSAGGMGPGALHAADVATTLMLAAGMFGLGMGIRARELWPIPFRAFVLAVASTVVAATVPLVLILLFL